MLRESFLVRYGGMLKQKVRDCFFLLSLQPASFHHSTDRPLPTTPIPNQSVNWYVLRQDSFRQKDGRHLARLDECSGKTVKRAFPLEGARIVPLAQPVASFQITLGSGRRIILQPESGTCRRVISMDGLDCPSPAATSHRRGCAPVHHTEDPADCVEWVSALQMAITMPNVRLASLTNFTEAAKRSTTLQRPSSLGNLDKVGPKTCRGQWCSPPPFSPENANHVLAPRETPPRHQSLMNSLTMAWRHPSLGGLWPLTTRHLRARAKGRTPRRLLRTLLRPRSFPIASRKMTQTSRASILTLATGISRKSEYECQMCMPRMSISNLAG